MSDISVTFTAASNIDKWEEMKPAVIYTWLQQACSLKHLVFILREEYNIISTEKTCRTHLQRWGLATYKKRQTGTHQSSSAQPPRRRKGTKFKAREDDSRVLLSLHPQNGALSPSYAFRLPEFVFYSIDVFVSHSLKERLYQQPKARDLIHAKVEIDYSLCWQEIADLYQAAEGYFKGECWKKFVNTIKKARLEIRILAGLLDSQPEEFQKMWQQAMITRFWRICHRLIKLDLRWPQYGYSFLLDFLIEFERLMSLFYGKSNPLGQLLRAIVQVDKEHIQMVVRNGASRTIGVMAPMIDERQRRMVMFAWTDFMYRN
ncbi:hypothetical protein FOPG_13403 [Fusarium oxysporum f. sp. conglutinans race 2 54008]|uniref:Clr5 domain-containing protein n=2 Tax=Fusarium oxysporum TaxID=5507 RepID=A0A2H3SW81_FUSOX|nr:hypothetical protein FOPG_13403 [Fusarium oxysporum f. sp. conglutinans race 2 54008]SCO76704.1 uncharacterized protein FRV6_00916 [Fusarium oxysporum]